MEIWLSKNNEDKIQLPVNPESIGSEFTKNFEDILLASGDERVVLSGSNLKTTTISSFFPANPTYYQQTYNNMSPMEYVQKIEKWMDERAILLFQVTGTNINRKVNIRSFTWEERGGSVGDIDYTLELKEYRPIFYQVIRQDEQPQTQNKTTKASTSTRPPSNKTVPKTYTVKKGDSLWLISKKFYGSGESWKKIYEANKNVIGKNPNLIYPGQKLVIP